MHFEQLLDMPGIVYKYYKKQGRSQDIISTEAKG